MVGFGQLNGWLNTLLQRRKTLTLHPCNPLSFCIYWFNPKLIIKFRPLTQLGTVVAF